MEPNLWTSELYLPWEGGGELFDSGPFGTLELILMEIDVKMDINMGFKSVFDMS